MALSTCIAVLFSWILMILTLILLEAKFFVPRNKLRLDKSTNWITGGTKIVFSAASLREL